MLWLSNLVVDIFRQGVPFVGTAVGAAYGLKRGEGRSTAGALGRLALYSGGGWLSGYLTSKLALRLLEGTSPALPQVSMPRFEESTTTASSSSSSLSGIAEPPSMPAGTVSVLPSRPRSDRATPRVTANGEVISIHGGTLTPDSIGSAYGA